MTGVGHYAIGARYGNRSNFGRFRSSTRRQYSRESRNWITATGTLSDDTVHKKGKMDLKMMNHPLSQWEFQVKLLGACTYLMWHS